MTKERDYQELYDRLLEEVERRGLAVEHHFYSAVLADLFAGSIRPTDRRG